MKIGVVCYPSVGGSGLVATELGLELARRGHEIHFISYATPFRLPHFVQNVYFHPVEPINYPLFNQNLYTLALTAKIIEIAEACQLELVHAHYSIPHSICAHLAREISGRHFGLVTTLHGTDVSLVGPDQPLHAINRYGIARSDAVTTVSRFQRELTIQTFALTNEIEVIYNFIDTDVFTPQTEECCRLALAAPEEKLIMHISNFREVKNQEGVIRTFARVRERIPARLVLVGDGPGMAEIRRRSRELGVSEYVRHLGNVDSVEQVLPLADVVFQPSLREAFGMVLLEAMACAVPTVSSNVDGIPEVAVHGETGYLAAPTATEELAEYLVALCQDLALNRRLGHQGRQRALECFHKDVIVPQYLACYERVLAAPR